MTTINNLQAKALRRQREKVTPTEAVLKFLKVIQFHPEPVKNITPKELKQLMEQSEDFNQTSKNLAGISIFSSDPINGIIDFPRYTEDEKATNHVIDEILRNNK